MGNRAEEVRKCKEQPGFPYPLIGRSCRKRTEEKLQVGKSSRKFPRGERWFPYWKGLSIVGPGVKIDLDQYSDFSVCWGERDEPANLQRER